MSLGRALWSQVGVFLLVAGVVLSPLRAMAAAIPMLTAYDVSVAPSTTTRIEAAGSVRRERKTAAKYVYDNALDGYDGLPNRRVTTGAEAVVAYDGAREDAFSRAIRPERAIYDDDANVTAAEGEAAAVEGLKGCRLSRAS